MTNPRDPPALVPLCALFGQELRRIYPGKPSVLFGHGALAKRGEDLILTDPARERLPGDPSTAFSVFGIFDGHNGVSAAVFVKDHLLEYVLKAIPDGIGREEWLCTLPRALVSGFVKADIDFQSRGEASGTTATLVVIDGLTVTVASVGDSRCILDSRDGVVTLLSVDHRLEENAEERDRVKDSGGDVYRVTLHGGKEIGPLRCWPGGLCLSRSIGDSDVGEFIVPVPHVKQVKLPSAGGRLIIASDGIWDALSSELAAKVCRGLPAQLAAKMVVKEALRTSGLKDDTTCMVVDIIGSDPPAIQVPPTPKKNQNKLRSLFFGKQSLLKSNTGRKSMNKRSSLGAVEEIFEEGSAMLDERLATSLSLKSNTSPFQCAICQTEKATSTGSTGSDASAVPPTSNPREPLFLCADCRRKKEAMEGKCSTNR